MDIGGTAGIKAFLAIDSWVHIFVADVVYGLFGRGAHFEHRLDTDLKFKLDVLFNAMFEGKQLLESSRVVQIGSNCVIDPTAVIHGPTSIGNNVTIGAGAVIENSVLRNSLVGGHSTIQGFDGKLSVADHTLVKG